MAMSKLNKKLTVPAKKEIKTTKNSAGDIVEVLDTPEAFLAKANEFGVRRAHYKIYDDDAEQVDMACQMFMNVEDLGIKFETTSLSAFHFLKDNELLDVLESIAKAVGCNIKDKGDWEGFLMDVNDQKCLHGRIMPSPNKTVHYGELKEAFGTRLGREFNSGFTIEEADAAEAAHKHAQDKKYGNDDEDSGDVDLTLEAQSSDAAHEVPDIEAPNKATNIDDEI